MFRLKKRPFSFFIAILLIVVELLYATKTLRTIPCQNKINDLFLSNFVHTDIWHLLTNLYGLAVISKIEEVIGTRKFMLLIAFNLLTFVTIDYLYRKVFNAKCSVGFSGILYGLLFYELIEMKQISVNLGLSVILYLAASQITNSSVSLSSHLIGIISGIISTYLMKIETQIKLKSNK